MVAVVVNGINGFQGFVLGLKLGIFCEIDLWCFNVKIQANHFICFPTAAIESGGSHVGMQQGLELQQQRTQIFGGFRCNLNG